MMDRVKHILLAVLLLALIIPGAAAQEPDWSYEGETGPQNWGSLSADYTDCATGTMQSPINIEFAAIQEGDFPALVFDYQDSAVEVTNDENRISVLVEEGSTLEVDGTVYELKEVAFHLPSEHTVEGEQADMEMHLIHESDDGDLAVVAVFIESSDEENSALAPVWAALPAAAGESAAVEGTLNMGDFVDPVEGFLMYTGSLTTPPCTENVIWLLWNGTVQLSEDQIAAFAAVYENNVRPTQPSNDRPIFLRGS